MPSQRIRKENINLPHYLTLTTLFRWYYIFDRHNRFHILKHTLEFQIENRLLKVYAFVFMLIHIHLIVQSTNLIAFVRDFKKFTTYQIKKVFKYMNQDYYKIIKGIDQQGRKISTLAKN